VKYLRLLIYAWLLLAWISLPEFVFSQNIADSVVIDSRHEKKFKSPRKASLYSAVLPGAGQVYNQKYWKAPIVWIGMGTFTYFALDNQQEFLRFKNAYLLRQDGGIDEFFDVLTPEGLVNEMDRWRRYRDLNIIGGALFYVLQIIDANVDASLSDFDVSDDLSIRLMPPVNSFAGNSQVISVSLSLRF
jgi:hypothetical protein